MKARLASRAARISAVLMMAGALIWVVPGTANASTCVNWSGGQPVNPSSGGNILYAVSVMRPCNVWVVGIQDVGSIISQTLAEHWNGLAWSTVPSSNPGGSAHDSNLLAVSARSSADAWAVGHYSNGTALQTLTELLSGGRFEQISSPNPGGPKHDNELLGVTTISPSNAWAVGGYFNGTRSLTLIEHWNGASWSQVRSPNTAAHENVLLAVAATSARNVWAVGFSRNAHGLAQTLTEHWNGTTWKLVPSPDPGGTSHSNYLVAVAAGSASNAWAVGEYFPGAVVDHPLIEHWNGKTWKGVQVPRIGRASVPDALAGVTIVSANDAWAVGSLGLNPRVIVVNWNGKSWVRVPSPNPGSADAFLGVASSSRADVWAVGTYNAGGPDLTFAEHCC